MTHLVMFEQPNATPLSRGLVTVDIDPAAERVAILDRRNLLLLFNGVKPASGIANIIMPFEYTNGFDLVVFIIDDGGTPSYNMMAADKVKAELINAKLL